MMLVPLQHHGWILAVLREICCTPTRPAIIVSIPTTSPLQLINRATKSRPLLLQQYGFSKQAVVDLLQ